MVDRLLLARLLLWLRNGHIKLVAADHASMRRRYVSCNGIFGNLVELRGEGCWIACHLFSRLSMGGFKEE